MYLSRVKINTRRRETLKAMSALTMFHGAIENSFNGERKRHLWRIDKLRGDYYILILSDEKPDLNHFNEQFGFDDGEYESRCYDKLLDGIEDGSFWRFRLVANPTYSEKKDGAERGTVHAHSTIEHQKKWLRERSEGLGFSLVDNLFDVKESKWYQFKKGSDNKVRLLAVAYEGVLQVKDADLFRETLTNGIGREKAYGMGLLTIIKVEEVPEVEND